VDFISGIWTNAKCVGICVGFVVLLVAFIRPLMRGIVLTMQTSPHHVSQLVELPEAGAGACSLGSWVPWLFGYFPESWPFNERGRRPARGVSSYNLRGWMAPTYA
jgi:hypothetical protein